MLATEALFLKPSEFLLRQRQKFSRVEVQARWEYRNCGYHRVYRAVPQESARDGAKAARPFESSRALITLTT